MANHGDYERSDAKTGPLWVGGIVLALLIAVSMWASLRIDQGLTEGITATHTANPVSDLRQAPETPLLQAVPAAELERHRRAEEAALHAPASWIDPVNGIVRLPIEEAMQKVLAEGLPVRTEEQR